MKKVYIAPDLTVVELCPDGEVLEMPIVGSGETDEFCTKGETLFEDEYTDGNIPSRGSIWDNEW